MLVLKRKYLLSLFLAAVLWIICSWGYLGMYAGDASLATLAPVSRGSSDQARVSLMFNVDWGEEYIPEILDILKSKGVKATFFLTGAWVEKNPDLAKRIVSEGHEVGNHGQVHAHIEDMSKERLQDLILKGEETIFEFTGARPSKLFAPPYGEWNDSTVSYASEIGYQTILWTVDTVDWRNPPPETIWKRALSGAAPGALILLHPTEPTVEALPVIIDGLKEKGLLAVTVSENLGP
ncbi:MAG: polysaccharide deacetylase family protein [Candidatus Fermentithermobacillus carboniphilus]|uniref:Polysaccharide deacetylase family protein n=1 Tax=Candidatus Fermentithermobacillus carboniphilus TaxID=3085328 RepID=A0AAT9LEL0_9FIRM|nr:MAG: polysaccharide deacetylase family protein [Candidatus Fermentithermobacillus carboniphilus]